MFTARYLLDLSVCFKVHLVFKVYIPTRYGAIPVGVFSLISILISLNHVP